MSKAASETLKPAIYIDALALVPDHKSGVGYTLEQTLNQLLKLPKITERYNFYLVLPLGKAKYLQDYIRLGVQIKTIYLPAKVLDVLLRLNIFPPVDWLLGRGTYIFPNYRNCSLWHSYSLTYVYDIGFIRFPETVQPKNQRYLARYIHRWVTRSDVVVTITNQVKLEVEKYLKLPDQKVRVVYCGVDRSVFYKRSHAEVVATKKKYDIPYDNYFLFVGNIEPRKNLLALLEAYVLLPEAIRATHGLVLVGGDGWLNETFHARLKQLQAENQKIIKVAAYVTTDDLPALYSGARALVHPAVYEGFGLPPLEAMACQTPVVVSDIPAIHEVVGDNAYYINPDKPQAISDGMAAAIKNTKQTTQLVEAAKGIAEIFSWQSSAKQLLEIVEARSQHPLPRPVIKRLKSAYIYLDRNFRALLGDRAFSAYYPTAAASKAALRNFILSDFAAEQPNFIQVGGLAIYQHTKHALSSVIKRALRP